uniref:HAT C-terminal dimerisation domain-containing protein n=1 Tax=Quercus lobata TaxID=97700 RepID=A0A7N2M6I6_QUELO
MLSILISTFTSKFVFSVGERVIDQFRSTPNPDVIESLVCTKDWLYGDKELVLLQLDDLTEDIVNLDINKKCKDDSSSIDSFISSSHVS